MHSQMHKNMQPRKISQQEKPRLSCTQRHDTQSPSTLSSLSHCHTVTPAPERHGHSHPEPKLQGRAVGGNNLTTHRGTRQPLPQHHTGTAPRGQARFTHRERHTQAGIHMHTFSRAHRERAETSHRVLNLRTSISGSYPIRSPGPTSSIPHSHPRTRDTVTHSRSPPRRGSNSQVTRRWGSHTHKVTPRWGHTHRLTHTYPQTGVTQSPPDEGHTRTHSLTAQSPPNRGHTRSQPPAQSPQSGCQGWVVQLRPRRPRTP